MVSNGTKLGVSEVQSIDRAAEILRAVSECAATGAKLADVVATTGLTRTTAHRMMQALVSAGLLEQDAVASRYYLGVWLIHLSEMAAERFGLERLTQDARARLAARTGDTVFLSIRNGSSMVCSARAIGSFPVKVLTLDVGSRRPLGVGAGGLAILAFLSDTEQKLVLKACAKQYPSYNLDRAHVSELCSQSRDRGFSIDRGVVLPGVTGVGVPLKGPDGEIVASLSVAAISERMTDDRIEEVATLLKGESVALAALMKSTEAPRGRPRTSRPLRTESAPGLPGNNNRVHIDV